MRTLFSYATQPFELVPALEESVAPNGMKADTLLLKNGCTVSAYPCRPQSVRGLRLAVAVCDELAFYRSSEGYPTGVEMLRSVRPALSMSGGKLVILSSPYGQSGPLYDLHRKHFGVEDSETLMWRATAPQMNETLPQDYLERMKCDDPEAYRSEVLGEFRAGLAMLFDPEAVDASIVEGRRELPPQSGVHYQGFVDVSGGRRDSYVAGVCHREKDTVVIDALRSWTPPFQPEATTREASEFFKTYRIRTVESDKYGGSWPEAEFTKHGITCRQSAAPKSELYLRLLPAINSGSVELLDHADSLRELRTLERRRGASKDRVDHQPGGHDDLANVIAGLVAMALDKPGQRRPGDVIMYDTSPNLERDPRPMRSRLPETHGGIPVEQHAKTSCKLCQHRAAELVGAQH